MLEFSSGRWARENAIYGTALAILPGHGRMIDVEMNAAGWQVVRTNLRFHLLLWKDSAHEHFPEEGEIS